MIGGLRGRLVTVEGEEVVLDTPGGVAYEVHVPLGVAARLPRPGGEVSLLTALVVREDEWLLFGFDRPEERTVFRRLLEASGVGPRLALAILSTLGPGRTVRSIQERDLAALATVGGVGRKKAERIVLELRDRLEGIDLGTEAAPTPAGPATEAVRALQALGYAQGEADAAVRQVLANGGAGDTAALVRSALTHLTAGQGGPSR